MSKKDDRGARPIPGRMTISVPHELKARMEAVEEPISWSAVACKAFENELASHIKKRGAKDMSDVVNRLRASKRAAEGRGYQEGYGAGERWAKDDAEAVALERLEYFRETCNSHGGSFEAWFNLQPWGGWSHAEMLAGAILAGVDEGVNLDIDEVRAAADRMFPATASAAWLRGFVDGSLDVWEAVKDAL